MRNDRGEHSTRDISAEKQDIPVSCVDPKEKDFFGSIIFLVGFEDTAESNAVSC